MAAIKQTGGFHFKFVDEATSSKYACDVCYTVPTHALKAQCCSAIYCQLCAEMAQSQPEEQVSDSSLEPQSNLKTGVCYKCKKGNVQLRHDKQLQENINKLRVECPNIGCGWVGKFTDVQSHMKEPHDSVQDEIYDNDYAIHSDSTDSWTEQYHKAHTPALHSILPPTPCDTTAKTGVTQQEIPSVQPPATTTNAQQPPSTFQVEQDSLHSATQQDSLCWRSYNWFRNKYSGEFSDLSTSEKMLYVIGVLTATLWILLVVPTSIISLMSSIDKVRSGNTSFAPGCNYSVALLWLVILVHLVVVAFVVFWFSKGCYKPCKKKRMNRAAVSSLCIIILLYVLTVVGFSVSVLVFVNESSVAGTTNEGNGSSGMDVGSSSDGDGGMVSGSGSGYTVISASGDGGDGVTSASGDGVTSASGVTSAGVTGDGGDGVTSGIGGGVTGASGKGSGGCGGIGNGSIGYSGNGDLAFGNLTICNNETTLEDKKENICVEISSESFVLAMVFPILLIILLAAVSCSVGCECSHRGFCYRRTIYDPTVTVFENETSLQRDYIP